MVGICFFFETFDVDVWSGRSIDLDVWNYACKAAGDVDHVIVVNKTPERLRFNVEFNFEEVNELPHDFPGRVVHVCCPWDDAHEKISLWDFDHNVDWYVFGPAHGWRQTIDLGVYIPMAGQAALHSTHIASTVLLHRYGTKWQ